MLAAHQQGTSYRRVKGARALISIATMSESNYCCTSLVVKHHQKRYSSILSVRIDHLELSDMVTVRGGPLNFLWPLRFYRPAGALQCIIVVFHELSVMQELGCKLCLAGIRSGGCLQLSLASQLLMCTCPFWCIVHVYEFVLPTSGARRFQHSAGPPVNAHPAAHLHQSLGNCPAPKVLACTHTC